MNRPDEGEIESLRRHRNAARSNFSNPIQSEITFRDEGPFIQISMTLRYERPEYIVLSGMGNYVGEGIGTCATGVLGSTSSSNCKTGNCARLDCLNGACANAAGGCVTGSKLTGCSVGSTPSGTTRDCCCTGTSPSATSCPAGNCAVNSCGGGTVYTTIKCS